VVIEVILWTNLWLNMKYTFEEIQKFMVDKLGCEVDEVTQTCDINIALGCTGDDFHELIEAYTKKFGVEKMDNYLWYFHVEEEGHCGIGSLFFLPPNQRVKHIPVTPRLLLKCANAGRWLVVYPEHILPKYRYDLLINIIPFFLGIILIIYIFSIYIFLFF
jgi:hypothetical protein